MVLSITSSEEVDLTDFINRFAEGSDKPIAAQYTTTLPAKVGIAVPSSVSHAVIAYDLIRMGIKADGSLHVATSIVSFSYLWNEIRVKGGAYGASMSSSRNGSLLCHTYRDPSPARSIDKFANIAAFIDDYANNPGNSLDGFIISTLSNTDPLVSPGIKGRIADDFYLSGLSNDYRIRLRNDMLETTPDTLRKWSEAFRKISDEGSVCIVGSEAELKECAGLTIYKL